MSGNKKSLLNPYRASLFANNPSQLYAYQKCRETESTQDNSMNIFTDGNIKAVCLGGIRTEDNSSANLDKNDAFGSYIDGTLSIPLCPWDPAKDAPLPWTGIDATSFLEANSANSAISLCNFLYKGKSNFRIESQDIPQFGQIIDCYFEFGSLSNSNARSLRFLKPSPGEFSQKILNAATVEGVETGRSLFDAKNPSLLGGLVDGLDPRFPPREYIYVGSNPTYKNVRIQNGNLPSDLLGRPTVGRSKPKMLAEVIPSYELMAREFKKKFPNKTLSAWGYRTYARQITTKEKKPNLAARPGTSIHGWGQAVDIHYFIDGDPKAQSLSFSGEEYKWLDSKAFAFGWVNPSWARQGKKREEAWHWESSKLLFKKG